MNKYVKVREKMFDDIFCWIPYAETPGHKEIKPGIIDTVPKIKQFNRQTVIGLLKEFKKWSRRKDVASGIDLQYRRWIELKEFNAYINTLLKDIK